MAVHQAPCEASHTRLLATLAQPIEIKPAIVVAKEHRQPAIAALGDVMRHFRNTMRASRAIKFGMQINAAASITYCVPGIYDKLAENFLAMVQLASMRLWLRTYESTT